MIYGSWTIINPKINHKFVTRTDKRNANNFSTEILYGLCRQ